MRTLSNFISKKKSCFQNEDLLLTFYIVTKLVSTMAIASAFKSNLIGSKVVLPESSFDIIKTEFIKSTIRSISL
jgi:hypothetical protein